MKYVLKPHARQRLEERSINEILVKETVENPTRVGYDAKGRWLVKKLYRKNGKERLLLIVAEKVEDKLEIITTIDTSKINKYL